MIALSRLNPKFALYTMCSCAAGFAMLLAAEGWAARDQPRKKKFLNTGTKVIKRKAGKGKNKTEIDFEGSSIHGARRSPHGSLIGAGSKGSAYQFVKLRENWHDRMIESTQSLDKKR